MIFASIFAITGATLVLTSGNPHASDASPRHLRKLAVDSTSASPDRSEMEFAPGIVNTVHKLAAPFLEDQTNIFVFDEIDTRPIINTFFAIQDGQTISDVDAKMLAVWKQAWSGAGWNPRILNIGHAEAHPEYTDIVAKLDNDVPLGGAIFYNKSCFLRHFAMAALGGGWMTDYDTIPLNIDAKIDGRNFPNDGEFTTFEGHVPSLIVGSGGEWDRVSKALLQEGVNAGANEELGLIREGKPRLFSDMFALGELVTRNEAIVNEPHSVFQAHAGDAMASKIMAWDAETLASNLHSTSHQYCKNTKHIKALHFSHSATESIGYSADYRPVVIAAFLDRWSKLCDGPSFYFDDDADSTAVPEGEISPENNVEFSSSDIPNTGAISDALYDTDNDFAISRENSLLYVHIPKTGGSTFEKSSLFNDAGSHHKVGSHHHIDSMMENAEERQLSNFVKASHIRHPCDRFISAYAYLSSDKCNEGDAEWARRHIGDKSIDDFALELEKDLDLRLQAHFMPMWPFLFHPDGTFGIDVAMCQETWNQGLDKLANGFNIPVPDDLYTGSALLKNDHSKCEELRPETRAVLERVYQMDYCIFGYDPIPQKSCPQLEIAPAHFTQRYRACSAQKMEEVSDYYASVTRTLTGTIVSDKQ
jgi:hypothetical protein